MRVDALDSDLPQWLARLLDCGVRAATIRPSALPDSTDDDDLSTYLAVPLDNGRLGLRDPYVARSADERLRLALEPGRIVLIVGPSKVGKTRTAFEARRNRWPQAQVLAPTLQAPLRQLAEWPLARDGDALALAAVEAFRGGSTSRPTHG